MDSEMDHESDLNKETEMTGKHRDRNPEEACCCLSLCLSTSVFHSPIARVENALLHSSPELNCVLLDQGRLEKNLDTAWLNVSPWVLLDPRMFTSQEQARSLISTPNRSQRRPREANEPLVVQLVAG